MAGPRRFSELPESGSHVSGWSTSYLVACLSAVISPRCGPTRNWPIVLRKSIMGVSRPHLRLSSDRRSCSSCSNGRSAACRRGRLIYSAGWPCLRRKMSCSTTCTMPRRRTCLTTSCRAALCSWRDACACQRDILIFEMHCEGAMLIQRVHCAHMLGCTHFPRYS